MSGKFWQGGATETFMIEGVSIFYFIEPVPRGAGGEDFVQKKYVQIHSGGASNRQ